MLVPTTNAVISFQDAVRAFSARIACTDAWEDLKRQCLALAKTDPDNAGACFLVAGFARSYVLLHDEEAVPVAQAQVAQRQLIGYLEMLSSSITDGSPAAKLSALNAVVLDYLQSGRVF